MEVRERRVALEAVGARCIAVGFSPPGELSRLVDSLEWPWPFLADAVIRRGRAVWVYRPASPDDRPSVERLITLLGDGGDAQR